MRKYENFQVAMSLHLSNHPFLNLSKELSNQWWDLKGPLRTLHHINPTRIMYIKNLIQHKKGIGKDNVRPFEGLKILDIGCGAGILTEVWQPKKSFFCF